MPNKVIDANQGVRQPANTAGLPDIINAGDIFTHLKYVNRPVEMMIPFGCIGIIHRTKDSDIGEISVVRDDCKAANKAKRALEVANRINKDKQ